MAPPSQPAPPNRPIIGVNTKMYFSLARTTAYTTALLSHLSSPSTTTRIQTALSKIDTFLLPTTPSLPLIHNLISTSGNTLLLGAQDCSPHDAGAYTGEVSPSVLKELGCSIVMVGHAERRRMFGETDAVVREKARGVVRNGMWPLVCVGEEKVTEKGVEGAAREVVRQVGVVLEGVGGEAEVVVAYEPVWAIGAKEPASAEWVRGVVRRVRDSEVVKGRRGKTRIVYGGAAGPGLWERLGGEVDGLFLGRFAHEPEEFVKLICEVAGV